MNASILDAQTNQDAQTQRNAELSADSGIDFARIDAIATALEQTGVENIDLFVNSPASIPSTPTPDYMLLSITWNSVQINSGSKISTLR